jgi:hypothetical protein
MLGFAKRRHEFLLRVDRATTSRESLSLYTLPALDALVLMTATASVLCYGIYSIESPTATAHPALILSTLFVAYGVARYVLLVFAKGEGGEPAEVLFRDPHIWGSVLLFVGSAVAALSGLTFPLVEK